MPLDPKKLEKLVDLADGMKRARCPACASSGQDKQGDHLRIYPDGKFGCCVHPGDRQHRKQIFALVGERVRPSIKVRVAVAKSARPIQTGILGRLRPAFASQKSEIRNQPGEDRPDGPDGVIKVESMTDAPDGSAQVQSQSGNRPDAPDGVNEIQSPSDFSRTGRTGERNSNGETEKASTAGRTGRTGLKESNGELFDYSRTLRTPQYSYITATNKIPETNKDSIHVKEFREGVRNVRQREELNNTPKKLEEGVRGVREAEEVDQPPQPAEKQERLPYIDEYGDMHIPFDSPERYHWWKGDDRLSPDQTLAEIKQRMETEKRKTQNGTGI